MAPNADRTALHSRYASQRDTTGLTLKRLSSTLNTYHLQNGMEQQRKTADAQIFIQTQGICLTTHVQ